MAARSYNINLVNRTGGSLRRLVHGLCHGEWVTEPPEEILPDQVGKWGSQSGGSIPVIKSIGTGTQGWVRYKAVVAPSQPVFGGAALEPKTEVLTIIWNNPFLGDTQVTWAARSLPGPCDDKPVGASTFETVGDGSGLLEMYVADYPEISEIEQPSFSTLANEFVAVPLLIYNISVKNKPYAYSTLGVRAASQQQQAIEPEIAPQRAIKRVVAVRGAALASWVADWVGRSAEGTDIVKVRVRINDASRLVVHVDDLSGHKPATFDVIEAPVTGFTFPHVDDVVIVPSTMSGIAVHHDLHEGERQFDDPHDVARARNLENTMIRRSTSTVADRIFVSDVAAIEIYGAYEDGATSPAKWKLRYARWTSKGKTLIDLLCDGVPPIK